MLTLPHVICCQPSIDTPWSKRMKMKRWDIRERSNVSGLLKRYCVYVCTRALGLSKWNFDRIFRTTVRVSDHFYQLAFEQKG